MLLVPVLLLQNRCFTLALTEDFRTHQWDAFLMAPGEVSGVLLAEGLLLLGIPLNLHLIPQASPGCCTLAVMQRVSSLPRKELLTKRYRIQSICTHS